MISKRMVLVPIRDAAIGTASGFIAKMIKDNEVKTYLGLKASSWFVIGELLSGLGLLYVGKGKHDGVASAMVASSAAIGGWLVASPLVGKFNALQKKLVRVGGESSNKSTVIPIGIESSDK